MGHGSTKIWRSNTASLIKRLVVETIRWQIQSIDMSCPHTGTSSFDIRWCLLHSLPYPAHNLKATYLFFSLPHRLYVSNPKPLVFTLCLSVSHIVSMWPTIFFRIQILWSTILTKPIVDSMISKTKLEDLGFCVCFNEVIFWNKVKKRKEEIIYQLKC